MQQPGSKHFPADPPSQPHPDLPGVVSVVMLHIKLKRMRMQQHGRKYFARRPPTPDPGGRGQNSFFQNIVMLHIKLNGIAHTATW